MSGSTTGKDPVRVAAGLRAAMHNPNVSEEARQRAAERLRAGEYSGSYDATPTEHQQDEHMNRVHGGYKATLNNDHASEQAKRHAQEALEAAGYHFERQEDTTEEEHQSHVLAGYKAVLHNPRVSKEAKAHATQYLQEHGQL